MRSIAAITNEADLIVVPPVAPPVEREGWAVGVELEEEVCMEADVVLATRGVVVCFWRRDDVEVEGEVDVGTGV